MITSMRLPALSFVLLLMLNLSGCGGGGGGGNPVIDDTRDIDDPLINGCLSDTGIDLFAAEADGVLGLTWNNNGDFDFSGGYQIHYGTASEVYSTTEDAVTVACTTKNCEYNLEGVTNDTIYHVIVNSLGSNNNITATSCELAAEPHILAFAADSQVNVDDGGTTQFTPKITSAWDGAPLFMVWQENGKVVLARSDDFGANWGASAPVLDGTAEASPSLAFRRFVPETTDPVTGDPLIDPVTGEPLTDPLTGEPYIKVPPAMFIAMQSGTDIVIVRADFPDGPNGAAVFGAPVTVGSGILPVVAAVGEHIEVAFEKADGTIVVTSSIDGGLNFLTEQRVDFGNLGGGDQSSQPSLAIDPETHNVYVAYHGNRVSADNNIYLNVSVDAGANYQPSEILINDDGGGNHQTNVSLAVDHRTGAVLTTWEDRRNGSADIYFTRSTDYGLTWDKNIQVGAGLLGDQTSPRAVADPGRNVYVVFIGLIDEDRKSVV